MNEAACGLFGVLTILSLLAQKPKTGTYANSVDSDETVSSGYTLFAIMFLIFD